MSLSLVVLTKFPPQVSDFWLMHESSLHNQAAKQHMQSACAASVACQSQATLRPLFSIRHCAKTACRASLSGVILSPRSCCSLLMSMEMSAGLATGLQVAGSSGVRRWRSPDAVGRWLLRGACCWPCWRATLACC
jgi:hypothetical protein